MFGTKLGHQQIQQWTCICVQKRHKVFLSIFERTKIRRMKVPFGIAQTGKAFRNEIARQFIFRMREFDDGNAVLCVQVMK
jgi:glycyl-tRNA synthetase